MDRFVTLGRDAALDGRRGGGGGGGGEGRVKRKGGNMAHMSRGEGVQAQRPRPTLISDVDPLPHVSSIFSYLRTQLLCGSPLRRVALRGVAWRCAALRCFGFQKVVRA